MLVAPRWFHYSGLATGVLSGALNPMAAQVDVAALAARHGVEHRIGEVSSVDLEHRTLTLGDGAALGFDLVSFNVGSVIRDPRRLADQPGVWTAKPLEQLLQFRERLQEAFRLEDAPVSIVVAGGGQSGFEIAAAVAGLAERHRIGAMVVLVGSVDSAWAPPAAISRLTRSLQRRGVVLVKAEVVAREDGGCLLSTGERLPCGFLVLASGLKAPPIVRDLGLPLSHDGRLRVRPTLQSAAHPAVYAVGDCCVLDDEPRPPAGIFGVRAGRILLSNLTAATRGAAPARFRPQRRWLSVMDLGDGTGLAVRGRAWWLGRSALRLKRRLDIRFVRRLQTAEANPRIVKRDPLQESSSE